MADLVHEIALLQAYQSTTPHQGLLYTKLLITPLTIIDKNEAAEKHLKYALKVVSSVPSDGSEQEYFHKKVTAGTIETTLGWHLYNAEEMEKALPYLQNSAESLERKYHILKKLPADVRSLLDRLRTDRKNQLETAGVHVDPAHTQKTPPKSPPTQKGLNEGRGGPATKSRAVKEEEDDEDEDEDKEEALTALSKEDRAAMSPQLKEQMKDTIEAVRRATQSSKQQQIDDRVLPVTEDEVWQPFGWDSVEESLLHTLQVVVDLLFLLGHQPHLIEAYAKKGVEVAAELYAFLEDPSLPKPSAMKDEAQVTDAAEKLRNHLLGYATILQLLNRTKEAEFLFTRATLLDNR